MPMDNRAIVRRIYEEVWNERRIELLDELISPSHALQKPHMSSFQIGPEVYKCEVLKFLKAFPDIRMTIEDIVGEHDKIVVVWTFSGTHDGEFMGMPATHKKVSVDGVLTQAIGICADGS
jgi:predicted ester cyclase